MRLHGGDMEIRSKLGAGTLVSVRLPIDGTGAPAAGDLVRLVVERADEPITVAQIPVKKSA